MDMLVSELLEVNPCYDPIVSKSGDKGGMALKALETYADFYAGGRNFELHKTKYLRSRPIEEYAASYRSNRLNAAYYTPHSGGIGANLCGTALQSPPAIEARPRVQRIAPAAAGKPKDDPRLDYWRSLNDNIDGKNSDTHSLAWALLESLIVHRRAYIVVNFPNGDKDATFAALSAKEVDDWQYDEDGKLEWVRTHCIDLVRSKAPYGPVDTERHTWTFYDATNTTEYVADKKIGTNFDPKASAVGKPEAHGFGVIPVFPIETEDNFWVMDRLFSTAHAYFNREASRSFAIDSGALSLPVVKTERDINQLVMANGFAIKLKPEANEDFFYRSQDAGIYKALQDDCDYLLGNLYGALNQMALQAAAKSGNPASGTKAMADSQAIKAFLSLLCSPVIAAFRNSTAAVQTFREEDDLIVQVHGMNHFDVQNIELEINRCVTFNSIPGMSPTARKESMQQAVRTYLPNLDEDTKAKIKAEFDATTLPELQSKNDQVVSPITNATTGGPQGFTPGQVSQAATKGLGDGKAANAA